MKQKILLLDNYDSFTYNLKDYVDDAGDLSCTVIRNDELHPEDAGLYDAFIFSPGPGLPDEAGELLEIIRRYHHEKKMLGVCLGHQAMAVAAGGKLKQLDKVMHGLERKCVIVKQSLLYDKVGLHFTAGRYHSWSVDGDSLPAEWLITAQDENGEIMSMEHATLPLFGVQYHPESIMTPCGKQILRNWLNI